MYFPKLVLEPKSVNYLSRYHYFVITKPARSHFSETPRNKMKRRIFFCWKSHFRSCLIKLNRNQSPNKKLRKVPDILPGTQFGLSCFLNYSPQTYSKSTQNYPKFHYSYYCITKTRKKCTRNPRNTTSKPSMVRNPNGT
jgi:hypothetical protein